MIKTQAIAIDTGIKLAVMRIVYEAPEAAFSDEAAKANGFVLANGIYSRELTDAVIEAEIKLPFVAWKRVDEADLPSRADRARWKYDLSVEAPVAEVLPPSELQKLRTELDELKAIVTTQTGKEIA
jgi:hypothetical protein